MTNKRTVLGIVGRGYWGTIYVNTIKPMSDVVIPLEFILGKNYKNMLNPNSSHQLQGVIIATPPSTHFEVAEYLLKSGFKKLLVEKPLTDNTKTSVQLKALQESIPESLIMVGHVHLYDPAYLVMKNITKARLGKIHQINYISLKSKPVEGSTVLKHLSPHPLSIFLDMLDKNPKQVEAHSTEYDNVELNVEFENKILGRAKMGTIYPERKRELEIIGENGKLFLNEFLNPRELIFIDKDNKKENLSFGEESPLEMQVREFVNCIKNNIEPKSNIRQGVEVVKIMELAQKSFERHVPSPYL